MTDQQAALVVSDAFGTIFYCGYRELMEPRLSRHDEVVVECSAKSYRNSDQTPESEIVRAFPLSVVMDIRKTHHIAASVRCHTKSFNSLGSVLQTTRPRKKNHHLVVASPRQQSRENVSGSACVLSVRFHFTQPTL